MISEQPVAQQKNGHDKNDANYRHLSDTRAQQEDCCRHRTCRLNRSENDSED